MLERSQPLSFNAQKKLSEEASMNHVEVWMWAKRGEGTIYIVVCRHLRLLRMSSKMIVNQKKPLRRVDMLKSSSPFDFCRICACSLAICLTKCKGVTLNWHAPDAAFVLNKDRYKLKFFPGDLSVKAVASLHWNNGFRWCSIGFNSFPLVICVLLTKNCLQLGLVYKT